MMIIDAITGKGRDEWRIQAACYKGIRRKNKIRPDNNNPDYTNFQGANFRR